MGVTLEYPVALVAMAVAVWPWVLYVRSRRGGRSAWLPAVVQSVALLLAAATLAGPRAGVGGTADLPWLLLSDASASARTQHESDTPLPWAPDAARTDLAFARGIFPDAAAISPPDRMTTDAAAALRAAAARGRRVAGIVIRTDGRFRGDSWRLAAQGLAAAQRDVLIVPMESPPIDARITDVSITRRTGGGVTVRIGIAANAAGQRVLRVDRTVAGQRKGLLHRTVAVDPDVPAVIHLNDAPDERSVAVYHAALSAGDAFPENDSASAVLRPRTGAIAVVGNAEADIPAAALQASGATVARLTPDHLPVSRDGWSGWAGVLIVDRTGRALSAPQRTAAEQFVRAGGGLVVIGAGPHDTPDDRRDPLNSVLPLTADPFSRRSLAVSVVLDASGSMAASVTTAAGPRRKFDRAVEAVLGLQRHLTDGDALTVVTFSDRPKTIYRSGDPGVDFAALRRALQDVRPAGPTRVDTALIEAAAAPAGKRQRLIIVVSDLVTQPFDVTAAAARLKDADASLAIVAVVAADPPSVAQPLERLAGNVGARLVKRKHLAGLVDVFADFLSRARGGAMRAGQFELSAAGAFGVSEPSPPVGRYVVSAVKDRADVIGRIASDEVVARWQIALGRSVVIAVADDAWQGSSFARALSVAAVRWAAAADADARFSGELTPMGDRLRLRMTVRDGGRGVDLLKLKARWLSADGGDASEASVPQTAPGLYEASLPCSGEVMVDVVDDRGTVRWRSAIGQSYPVEFSAIGPDWVALRSLAELTGGRIINADDVPGNIARLQRQRAAALWPWLLGAAIALMLIEWVLVRR